VEPGSVIRRDGRRGQSHVNSIGYEPEVIVLKNKTEDASELLPHVHPLICIRLSNTPCRSAEFRDGLEL
jgi:hypothetical protein